MFFLMAWRNIWRNPRRTTVILAAVVIGVWGMIFLGALMRGMVDGMITNGIATLTGNLQIHQQAYRRNPTIDNIMRAVPEIEKTLAELLPPGGRYVQRIRVNAIASNARHSTGVTLVGIQPAKEKGVSFIGNGVVAGKYLAPGDKYDIIVGQAFLDKFETQIGHKLVLMSQDTDKQIVSQAFTIVGVFKAGMEETEKNYVFVSLSAAKHMLKLGKEISEISVSLPERGLEEKIKDKFNRQFGAKGLKAETWKNLLPLLKAYLDVLDGFMHVWNLVIFTAMSFGIVNTTLMAIFERMREFGLLKALGMKPFWIIKGVLIESFIVLLIGTGIGNILGFIFVYVIGHTGINLTALAAGAEKWGIPNIIYPVMALKDIVVANSIVLVLGLVVSAYPAIKAARFRPVQAMLMD
jgi:ABC-type lipoprotein release transport system permease subunit